MVNNRVRTSAEVATIASHALSGRIEAAAWQMHIYKLIHEIELDEIVEEVMKSLAGSALSNRRG